MRFFRRASVAAKRLGILPGTFNPVTVAHLALARAALAHVDEVVFVLPRVFPHKDYSGASFDDRVAMLEAAIDEPAFSIATAEGGLFVEIARECRVEYGENVRLAFLCGRDAAERIAGWDYGRPNAFAEMISEFELLVAARDGRYEPLPEHAKAVRCLDAAGTEAVSATEVRERLARGEPWEHLVPEAARAVARRVFGAEKSGVSCKL
jgi:nicotinate-nucleotide adenylyltransferase